MLAAVLSALAAARMTSGADEILLREGCVILLGRAWVEGDGQRLEARAAVFFPGRGVVYAEGDVLFTDEKARAAIEAEEFVYDFAAKRGAGREVRLTQRFARKSPEEGRLEKGELDHLVVRAKRLFREGEVFRAEDVVASSCNFGLPHWSVTADEMRLRGRKGVARGARIRLGSVTILKLRSVGFGAEEGLAIPSPRLSAGHSSKWGVFYGAGVRLKPRGVFDYVLPFVGHRTERGVWGELSFRGPGRFEFSFQDESQTSASDDAERADRCADAWKPKLLGTPVRRYRSNLLFQERHGAWPVPDPEDFEYAEDFRYDVEYYHSWRRGGWKGSCEVSCPSDRDYLREYDDSRLKKARDGETALYLWHSGRFYSELAASYEPCEWRTSTERLPQLSFTAPVVALPGGAVLETDFSAGYLRKRWDELWREAGEDDFDSFRAAGSLSLSRPFRLGPVGVRPFVGASGAYYWEGDEGQGAYVVGVEARTFLLGEFHGGKLRHIVEPRVSLLHVGPTLMDPVDVLDFDEADDLHETSVARFELANLWQAGAEGRRSTVGALRLWTDAFLDADEAGELNSDRTFDLLNASGFYEPRKGLRLFGHAGFDAYEGAVARAGCGVAFGGKETGAALAHRFVGESEGIQGSSELSVRLWWFINPRWRISCAGAYQFEDNDQATSGFSAGGVVIERHYHDWAFRMRFKYDEGRDETSLGVGLVVKGYTSNLEGAR